ncbi:putative histone acetyltransferase [Rosa chinensis]|uniref:Putative histone acetyltransferase n=1 Tax=Rosa chinensis TaxID=74649 RepID=A0A2P6RIL6_ROSCH|nr:putative histone acetyltransferase [Rosa chinensis]
MSMGSSLPISEAIRVRASSETGRGSKTRDSDLVRENARNHLLATGWTFLRARKSNNYMELRYYSPAGKVFYSLRTAFKSVVSQSLEVDSTTSSPLFCMKTCSSRKRRKIKMRTMEDVMNDERFFLSGIDRLLGSPSPVNGRSDLSWTLLKSDLKENNNHNLKLNQALKVMHQCFKPSKDPLTHKDVAEDIIFNREREFYTVVLEKQDKVVTAANVRIHGVVAELPLMATKFKYRRQGMCKILMNEIENWLRDSGIERLVLPSAQSALKTWTSSSIGFSTMTEDDKADLLIAYDCLDFQDTVMCEKQLILKKNENGDGESSDEGSTISHEDYTYGDDD